MTRDKFKLIHSDLIMQVQCIENDLKMIVDKDRWNRFHHQAVLFGRYYCKAVKPLCDDCKLKDICKKSN